MGLEKIINRMDPFCREISLKTSKQCYVPISLTKGAGLSGLIGSAYALFATNADSGMAILIGATSGIIYTIGVMTDYVVNRIADRAIKQKEEELQKEFEELYQEHIRNEVIKEEMIEKYPILEDYELNKRFPEIKDVALYIYSRIRGKSVDKMWGIFDCFAKL
jgi:hypothetical protein